MSCVSVVDGQVPSGSNCDLVGYVPRKNELTIVPANLDLVDVRRLDVEL